MTQNALVVGSTGSGKSKATVREILKWPGAVVLLDWHTRSTAHDVLAWAPESRILYDNLSDTDHALTWDFFPHSTRSNPDRRAMENHRNAELLKDVLQRRQGGSALAASPLKEEWIDAPFNFWLEQREPQPLSNLPFGLIPESRTFESLLHGCTNETIRRKFDQLRQLTPRALRAEVGPALRLLQGTFGSPAFALRSSGRPFDFAAFLQSKGILIVERGDVLSADAAGTMMGAIILKTIDHAKRRPFPHPSILLILEEANNAGLLGKHESQALAETRKFGLFFRIVIQSPTFPQDIGTNVTQNCGCHEWFRCGSYDIAREAAQDIAAGFSWLSDSEISRAEHLARLITELLHMPAGWRYVRDQSGSRKEYIPLLKDPWTWASLQEPRLREKLVRIRRRHEYAGRLATERSSLSCENTPLPPVRSPRPFSPAQRWNRRRERRPTGG